MCIPRYTEILSTQLLSSQTAEPCTFYHFLVISQHWSVDNVISKIVLIYDLPVLKIHECA